MADAMRRAVFLDRDGVLNRTIVHDGIPYPPASIEDVEVLPGVEEALTLLRQHAALLVVVSNQPDVARGTQTRVAIEEINRYLMSRLPLHAIFTCYHDTADRCDCRKPRPGLLLWAARCYGIDLPRSFMVGDRWSDVAAGQAAGCYSLLIDVPYNQRQRCHPDDEAADLFEAAQKIVRLLRMPRER